MAVVFSQQCNRIDNPSWYQPTTIGGPYSVPMDVCMGRFDGKWESSRKYTWNGVQVMVDHVNETTDCVWPGGGRSWAGSPKNTFYFHNASDSCPSMINVIIHNGIHITLS